MDFQKLTITAIGNLTKNPENRVTPAGDKVCSFTIAVNEKHGDQETTDYYKVSAWRKLADTCERYLKKGSKVFVYGTFKARKYIDGAQCEKYSMDINADNIIFISNTKDAEIRTKVNDTADPMDALMKSGFEEINRDDLPF